MRLDKSLGLLTKAEQLIPCQTQTFSKGPDYFPKGAYPVYLQRGQRGQVWDVDGNRYVEFICGLGAVTLGYNYPAVNEAIMRQLQDGIIFSLPHPLEVRLAELLTEIIPCAESVRFSKTGSEVTSAAIKAARAYTGNYGIAHWGYHGWHDWYSIVSDRPKGIPPIYKNFIHTFEYNNIESLERIFFLNNGVTRKIAAVIMEPVTFTPPKDNFLQDVKDLTHKNGAVLIFDEMATGFRMALGGAQEYFRVTPDLATFGKGIANGMPISAVVGKREIMEMFEERNEVFFSTTFGGECLSLAAAIATIEEMRQKDVISYIWNLGRKLMREVNRISGLKAVGYPCRPMIVMENETPESKSLLMAELAKRGILIHSGALNLCYSHTDDDIDRLIWALTVSMREIKEGKVRLEGQVAKMSFRRL